MPTHGVRGLGVCKVVVRVDGKLRTNDARRVLCAIVFGLGLALIGAFLELDRP